MLNKNTTCVKSPSTALDSREQLDSEDGFAAVELQCIGLFFCFFVFEAEVNFNLLLSAVFCSQFEKNSQPLQNWKPGILDFEEIL